MKTGCVRRRDPSSCSPAMCLLCTQESWDPIPSVNFDQEAGLFLSVLTGERAWMVLSFGVGYGLVQCALKRRPWNSGCGECAGTSSPRVTRQSAWPPRRSEHAQGHARTMHFSSCRDSATLGLRLDSAHAGPAQFRDM